MKPIRLTEVSIPLGFTWNFQLPKHWLKEADLSNGHCTPRKLSLVDENVYCAENGLICHVSHIFSSGRTWGKRDPETFKNATTLFVVVI